MPILVTLQDLIAIKRIVIAIERIRKFVLFIQLEVTG